MPAFLALDWGQKKVGYATADSEGIVITPRGHFKRKPGTPAWKLSAADRAQIQKLLEEFEAEVIVLGLPLRGDGSETEASTGARNLAEQLGAELAVPVHLVNEVLTSWENRMAKDDDAAAAASLLQDYFAGKKRNPRSGIGRAALLVLLLVLGVLLWLGKQYSDFSTQAMAPGGGSFMIDVAPGSSFASLRAAFEAQGISMDRRVYRAYLALKGQDKRLRVGEYQISKSWSRARALDVIFSGQQLMRRVTVKEGFNIYDIKAELDRERKPQEVGDFLNLLRDETLMKRMGVPENLPVAHRSLEGFLFPETYSFSKYDPPRKLIISMLEQFEKRARPLLEQHEWSKTPEGLYQLLTLASIVEKESGNAEEQPLVASVFWNRLNKRMKLQSDPTTIYGLLPNFDGNIRKKDLLNPTPYNTYTIPSLPVGPISNPGESAIRAVLNPAKSNYLFFVSRGDGSHVFSEDYKTHDRYVTQYQLKGKAIDTTGAARGGTGTDAKDRAEGRKEARAAKGSR